MYNKCYHGTTIFGERNIQKDRSARFTGKPYDEDLQAYVFPYRNYDASTPAGAPQIPLDIRTVSTTSSMRRYLH